MAEIRLELTRSGPRLDAALRRVSLGEPWRDVVN